MDLLREEMARKRKAVEELKRNNTESSNNRFVIRAAQLRALEVQEEVENERKRFRKNRKKYLSESGKLENGEDSDFQKDDVVERKMGQVEVEEEDSRKKKANDNIVSSTVDSPIDDTEIIRKLRELGQPTKLFAESKEARRQRLEDILIAKINTTVEEEDTSRDEFRLGSGHGIRNPFLAKDGDDDDTKKGKDEDKEAADHTVEDENDEHKRIYRFFKTLLRQWEDELASRPEEIKRSAKGKVETKTLKQCKDYIRPLFKQCKKRTLAEDIMAHIIKIIDFCEAGEFVKAHDAYMDVAIGRAAWPIGVTMVGIHARSGREKIETGKVAHAMNSELQRKYLTSIKRLMTFCQKQRDDVLPSKKVIN